MGPVSTKIKYTFLKSEWKDGFFYTPFAIFEEKSFHILKGIKNIYRSKIEETA